MKSLAVVAVVAGVATAGFEVRETKATVTAPSGTCGLLLSRNFGGFNTYMQDSNDVGSTMSGTINFDAKTASGNVSLINNYGKSNAVNVEKAMTSTLVVDTTATSGVYLLTMTTTAVGESTSYIQKYDLISTNSGNTYLLRSKPITDNNTGAWSGVCQAL